MDGHGLWTLDELTGLVETALSVDYDGAATARVRDVPDQRAIRWYVTRGLVDRPAGSRGRVALYGRRHLLQLVAIKRRQADGRSLSDIQAELTGATDQALATVARLPADRHPAPPTATPSPDRFWTTRPTTAPTDRPTPTSAPTAPTPTAPGPIPRPTAQLRPAARSTSTASITSDTPGTGTPAAETTPATQHAAAAPTTWSMAEAGPATRAALATAGSATPVIPAAEADPTGQATWAKAELTRAAADPTTHATARATEADPTARAETGPATQAAVGPATQAAPEPATRAATRVPYEAAADRAAEAAPVPESVVVQGIRLAPGVTLLIEQKGHGALDPAAVLAAARPLLDLLAAGGPACEEEL